MNVAVSVASLIAAAGLLVSSTGCASVDRHTEIRPGKELSARNSVEKTWPPAEHHNPGVRIPARVGAVVGGFVGVPVSLALFPVTAATVDSNLFPLVPMLVCAVSGETLFGAVAWPVFGWWHWSNEPPDGARSADL